MKKVDSANRDIDGPGPTAPYVSRPPFPDSKAPSESGSATSTDESGPRSRILPVLVVAIALLAPVGAGAAWFALQPTSAAAPDFTVPTTTNETFSLSGHQGRVVIIDFFSTWCASCKIVEANLKQALPTWNGTPVTVVSVGVDPTETIADLAQYQSEHGIPWSVALDTDAVAQKYNTYAIARVVIIDAQGQIVYEHAGTVDAATLQRVVAGALRGDAAAAALPSYGIIPLAILAGAASFFSPCSIGLLPAFVARASHAGTHPALRVAAATRFGLAAAVGLGVVFLAVGTLAFFGGPLVTRRIPLLAPLMGVVLIIAGFALLVGVGAGTGPLGRLWGQAAARLGASVPTTRSFAAFGAVYALAAAGCTAPVFLGLFAAAAAAGAGTGVAAVAGYVVAGATLMLLATLLSAAFGAGLGPALARHARSIHIASAMAFVVGGAYLLGYAYRAGVIGGA